MVIHKPLHPRDDIDSMCQEKKEEEDLPALMIASSMIWTQVTDSLNYGDNRDAMNSTSSSVK